MSIKTILQSFFRLFSCKKSYAKEEGVIKFFDRKKRFGFIVAGKNEYFFHATAAKPQDFKALRDGAFVRFAVIQGKKGPQADHIEMM
ncbi:MAG: cold-shock protein [Legionellaceae bacterium]